jgi:3-oxoacyl-[acyl-carrier-protein] synthase-3
MNLIFSNRKISGILTVVPANERSFVDEMSNFNFPERRSLKLKEVMGYDKHRLVDGPVCVSDLTIFGLEYLFANRLLDRDEFDALIVVTQSPDYIMPATSSVIQGRLGLKQDMFCLDINQGCAGFLIGLMQGFLLLDQPSIQRVVLVNADVLSRKVSTKDRNSYPLVGDGASITILERTDDATPIYMNLKMDGTRRDVLRIPAGGMRLPSSPETAVMAEDADGNLRSLDNLVMDGSAVFNFVQVEVPPMIDDLLQTAGKKMDDVDMFLFHQPNRFMLEKLADKMGVPYEKMPANIVEHYGNSSGVTIPLAIAHNLRHRVVGESINACLAGFGVGLTWASMLMRIGPMRFCEMITF